MKNETSSTLAVDSTFSFKRWISGDGGLVFAVINSILFLMANYAGLLNQANPYMAGLLVPHSVIATIIYIQEAFFFGVVTIIIMIQAQRLWIKQLFCTMEGLCVFLYFSKGYIDEWTKGLAIDGQFALAAYVAIFSGISLFSLGMIFSIRLKEQDPNIEFDIPLNSKTKKQEKKQVNP